MTLQEDGTDGEVACGQWSVAPTAPPEQEEFQQTRVSGHGLGDPLFGEYGRLVLLTPFAGQHG